MRDQIFWVIAATIYLAILYTLVKPGSKGPQLVDNIFSTLSDLVRGAAGYTYDGKNWNAPAGGTKKTAVA